MRLKSMSRSRVCIPFHYVCIYLGNQLTVIELKPLGDIISFGPNAGRIFYRWSNGAVAARMRPLSIDLRNYGFRIHKWDTGEIITIQKTPEMDPEAPVFNGHRGELHSVVFHYARDELGIPIHLGQRVTRYWEDENNAGIILDDGQKVCPFLPGGVR